MAKAPKEKQPSQRERFIQAAREVEADEKEKTFDRMLKKVASAPPPKDTENENLKSPPNERAFSSGA